MLNPQSKLFRWGPISACPLFMYFTIGPAFSKLKDLIGYCYPESVIIFKDNKVTWLLDNEQFYDASKTVVTGVILADDKLSHYLSVWNERTNQLEKEVQKIEQLDLSKLTNEELVNELKKFSKIYEDWWMITISGELCSSYLEPLLGEKLKKYFPQEHPKDFNQAFATLTSPPQLTFYRQEQLDILKILDLPKSQQDKALRDHQQKYHWIYNSYLKARVLDIDYFKLELEKLEKADWRKLIEEIENYSSKIQSEKQKILSAIAADIETVKLADLVSKFGTLLDTRKANNFKGDFVLEIFVQEFAKRLDKNVEDLKLLTHDELAESFDYYPQDFIDKRSVALVFVSDPQNSDIFDGTAALTIADQFSQVKDLNESMIHGVLASAGESYYFRGTAKVVLTIQEIDKIQEGDILVTTMTSPDFVIGMKKAGAIITDVGGILSHAAIVSRELGKACIVGTQIATKVIRDGDIIELHCGRGTIKIIKHTQ